MRRDRKRRVGELKFSRGLSLLVVGWIAVISMRAQVLHPTEAMPSYEVATIKPWDGKGFAQTMGNYILSAFNLSPSSASRLIGGPDWINTKKYAIQGKPTDSMRDAMLTMTSDEQGRQREWMMQSLLAERFQLKAHFEMRYMQYFELVLAKGGSKMKEVHEAAGRAVMREKTGDKGTTLELNGTAMPMRGLISLLMANSDIGGRSIIDETGLTGTYDVTLDWVPMQTGTGPVESGGPGLFTALQEQLGLRLVAMKGPVEVVMIDHIEMPSQN